MLTLGCLGHPFFLTGEVAMTINQLWYFGMFIWGLVSAWAVIEGLKD